MQLHETTPYQFAMKFIYNNIAKELQSKGYNAKVIVSDENDYVEFNPELAGCPIADFVKAVKDVFDYNDYTKYFTAARYKDVVIIKPRW